MEERKNRARISVLLEVRHGFAIFSQTLVVHRNEPPKKRTGGCEQKNKLDTGVYKKRTLRQLDSGGQGLGDIARPLLGHASPYLGVRAVRRRIRSRFTFGPYGAQLSQEQVFHNAAYRGGA